MKIFTSIPSDIPETPTLDKIDVPSDIKNLSSIQLQSLADDVRAHLLYSVGQSGGHLGGGLGVIELTVALHYLYNAPEDKIVWDVGHQAYPHKILTGRKNLLTSIRQKDGLAPFPNRSESPFDAFGVGHSSTSISAALGMAIASQGSDKKVVAVIGDGAMTAGMAFEGLAHAGHIKPNMLIILNDNDMSISENVGGLNNYFSRIWASKLYKGIRKSGKSFLENLPQAHHIARKVETQMKAMVAPGSIFEELGLNYIGPIDGHNLNELIAVIGNLKDFDGPQFLHIITKKGAGLAEAEVDRIEFHAIGKVQPLDQQAVTKSGPKYQDVFGDWIVDMAKVDPDLLAITPAMREGSGLVKFSQEFPERFFDVAIAEQHAVTLAAGMACENKKPVVAIYSTFLQRAYDQLIHDVALQNLNVLFAIDRAGLVGEDGPTHSGNYDLTYLRCIPNMVIAVPSDEDETRKLLTSAYHYQGPAAVRYPRGAGRNASISKELDSLPIGKGRVINERDGEVLIVNFGALIEIAEEVAIEQNATLLDMRFVKPMDEELLAHHSKNKTLIVTIEDGAVAGGAGSAVSEWSQHQAIKTPVLICGIPDAFIEHATRTQMIKMAGLDAPSILLKIKNYLS
ncbi:MAG: 1-deoxy-D-xylulose-5-phosphate synthase [SAR86 cluster bacterium BACL1 MAG-121022-bin58]|jgi:1-deoxy-D-xylulose-5-phosphate synthase|nr:MAG: 1-deoxy-D-xylulose-5-phosphate synthase [SAR86 cluster bacterium BACL1 MAG-121022-bin58]KRP22729.1 MAG: 1-deoxy-D-xylulose-5-phosphate synthase [SAR86 cluster bacterium BACL1 MAG-121015-bin70]MDA0759637.1 1-deoxy-D-xylulose-5-phosphate synthase [Pseudomonadota bacterium]